MRVGMCSLLHLLLLFALILEGSPLKGIGGEEDDEPSIEIMDYLSEQTGYPTRRRLEVRGVITSIRVGITMSDIASDAKKYGKMIKFGYGSTVNFHLSLMKCTTPGLEHDLVKPSHGLEIYMAGPWIDYFINNGQKRCLREHDEFYVVGDAQNTASFHSMYLYVSSIANVTTHLPFHKTPWNVIDIDGAEVRYRVFFMYVVEKAERENFGIVNMEISNVTLKSVTFHKCGISYHLLLDGRKSLALEGDTLGAIHRLSYVVCDDDNNLGSVELTVQESVPSDAPIIGSILFDGRRRSISNTDSSENAATVDFIICSMIAIFSVGLGSFLGWLSFQRVYRKRFNRRSSKPSSTLVSDPTQFVNPIIIHQDGQLRDHENNIDHPRPAAIENNAQRRSNSSTKYSDIEDDGIYEAVDEATNQQHDENITQK